jgi:hypothetical protein
MSKGSLSSSIDKSSKVTGGIDLVGIVGVEVSSVVQ